MESLLVITMWGPQSIAKFVNITPTTMVYGTQTTMLSGVNKQTFTSHLEAPHCMVKKHVPYWDDMGF